MKEELDNKLTQKYPKIFKNRHGDVRTTAMCWGFSCGDGWYWLIDNLCDTMQNYYDHNGGRNGFTQPVAVQVKEKYGGLRFYIDGGNDKIDGMIWLAEHMSYNICEHCGAQENIGMTKGWNATLCKPCFDMEVEHERFGPDAWEAKNVVL